MFLFQDWRGNRNNLKGRYVLVSFRLASFLEKHTILKIILFPFYLHYKIWIGWVMGIELQSKVELGENCRLYHGQGLVVNSKVKIGKNCILRHNVTIGNKIKSNGEETDCPEIGNGCEIGAHSCIIGDIKIGNNVIVSSFTLVNKDVPNNVVIGGIPFKILKDRSIE